MNIKEHFIKIDNVTFKHKSLSIILKLRYEDSPLCEWELDLGKHQRHIIKELSNLYPEAVSSEELSLYILKYSII